MLAGRISIQGGRMHLARLLSRIFKFTPASRPCLVLSYSTSVLGSRAMSAVQAANVRGVSVSAHLRSTPGTISVNEVNLHYEIAGDSSNVVLCMPGALGTAKTDFGPQLSGLSKDFTVVSFDPRGYGQSIPPIRDFPINFYQRDAEDAVALMTSLGFNRFNVLGWSDGGMSGLILAGSRPELVEKLVVWGSQAYLTARDVELIEPTRDISNWSDRMRLPLEAIYGKEGLKRTWNAWIDAYLEFLNRPDGDICISYIPKITCPTFVIHGKKDPLVPDCHPEYLIKNIKNTKYYEFENGKHNLHLRYHEEFNKIVTEFLLSS